MMKKIGIAVLGCLLTAAAFTACSEDELVGSVDRPRLNFDYDENNQVSDTIVRYSFAFGPDEVMQDTIWLKVNTMGQPAAYDRPVQLTQQLTGENDAKAGVHYIPFNDPKLAKVCVIPAGAVTARIPVVVKRDDPSLKEKEVILRVGFQPNAAFDAGAKEFSFKRLVIADRLVEPANYSELSYFFGDYGPVRHRFLIEVSGEKWDDAYVDYLMNTFLLGGGDQNYLFYYAQKMHRALVEYNRTHDEPLCEEGGIPVEFEFGAGFE